MSRSKSAGPSSKRCVAEYVLHGDPGAFNTVFRNGLPVAFVDWSSARPGSRLDDLGYMAWTWCVQSQSRVPVDAARHSAARRRHAEEAIAWATSDRELLLQQQKLMLAALIRPTSGR